MIKKLLSFFQKTEELNMVEEFRPKPPPGYDVYLKGDLIYKLKHPGMNPEEYPNLILYNQGNGSFTKYPNWLIVGLCDHGGWVAYPNEILMCKEKDLKHIEARRRK